MIIKKIFFVVMCLVLIVPLVSAFTVNIQCPDTVAPGGAVACDLNLVVGATETVSAFQFKVSVPAGFTAGSPLVSDVVPLGTTMFAWTNIINNAIVYSLASGGLTTGRFGVIHLVAGTTSGSISLTDKIPTTFISNTEAITITAVPISCVSEDLTIGEWGTCSAPCGAGTQTRTITKIVPTSTCTIAQLTSQSCNLGTCPTTCGGADATHACITNGANPAVFLTGTTGNTACVAISKVCTGVETSCHNVVAGVASWSTSSVSCSATADASSNCAKRAVCVTPCPVTTVAHGTVTPAPVCTITCNPSYHLFGTSCVPDDVATCDEDATHKCLTNAGNPVTFLRGSGDEACSSISKTCVSMEANCGNLGGSEPSVWIPEHFSVSCATDLRPLSPVCMSRAVCDATVPPPCASGSERFAGRPTVCSDVLTSVRRVLDDTTSGRSLLSKISEIAGALRTYFSS